MKRLLLLSLFACSSSKPTEPAKPTPSAGPPSASRVVIEHFHSDALGVDKNVVVYLPAGYDSTPAAKWPVFYYLHGLGGNETNWTEHGKLKESADSLGIGAIIVMPDGDDGFYVDSASKIDFDACMKDGTGLFMPQREPKDTTCVRQRSYETYIAKDLVGWTDATYHTIAKRDGRGIAGLSMGGFGAMALALRHPDEFAAAASHSGAIALLFAGPRPFQPTKSTLITDTDGFAKAAGPIGAWIQLMMGSDLNEWKAHDVVQLASKVTTNRPALYIDCGTEDDFNLQDNAAYAHEALTNAHVEHEFFLGPGKHNFEFWSARLPKSLQFLRDHTTKQQ